MHRSLQKPNYKDCSEDNKTLCSAKLWKKTFLHYFPSDPNIRKEWINFIFNEVPDRVSKNGPLFTSLYRRFVYKKGTSRCRIFKKIETKSQCCSDYIGSDSNVAKHVNCFYYVVPIALSVKQIVSYVLSYLCTFGLNHSGLYLWRT